MEGIIVNFRRSMHHTSHNQLVIEINGVDSKEKASKLVGKKVHYNTGKKDMTGTVTAAHGNSGAIRARFDTGMPGQCIGKKVKLA